MTSVSKGHPDFITFFQRGNKRDASDCEIAHECKNQAMTFCWDFFSRTIEILSDVLFYCQIAIVLGSEFIFHICRQGSIASLYIWFNWFMYFNSITLLSIYSWGRQQLDVLFKWSFTLNTKGGKQKRIWKFVTSLTLLFRYIQA